MKGTKENPYEYIGFQQEIQDCREICERHQLGWPGWAWCRDVGFEVNKDTVLLEGELVLVTSKTIGGYYGSTLYEAKDGSLHQGYGTVISRPWDEAKWWDLKEQKQKKGEKGEYEQTYLF